MVTLQKITNPAPFSTTGHEELRNKLYNDFQQVAIGQFESNPRTGQKELAGFYVNLEKTALENLVEAATPRALTTWAKALVGNETFGWNPKKPEIFIIAALWGSPVLVPAAAIYDVVRAAGNAAQAAYNLLTAGYLQATGKAEEIKTEFAALSDVAVVSWNGSREFLPKPFDHSEYASLLGAIASLPHDAIDAFRELQAEGKQYSDDGIKEALFDVYARYMQKRAGQE